MKACRTRGTSDSKDHAVLTRNTEWQKQLIKRKTWRQNSISKGIMLYIPMQNKDIFIWRKTKNFKKAGYLQNANRFFRERKNNAGGQFTSSRMRESQQE